MPPRIESPRRKRVAKASPRRALIAPENASTPAIASRL
jgi:hypothetical protein